MVVTSCRCGTLPIATGSEASKVPAKIGSAEFWRRRCEPPLEDRTTVDLQSIHQRAPASSGVRASMESAWISRPTSSPKVR